MNLGHVAFELGEMRMHLDDLLKELQSGDLDEEDDWASLAISMGHILDHLCYAWNSKDKSPEELRHISQEEFERLTSLVPNFGGNRSIVKNTI